VAPTTYNKAARDSEKHTQATAKASKQTDRQTTDVHDMQCMKREQMTALNSATEKPVRE
jgi:hypothetical protein